ncbi:MAG: hypothetical protein GY835_22920, partial [bacterium]|nr:hypothetical protein [bacterium]
HRVIYSYDASERLLFRKHLDGDDAFLSERLFVWDDAGLAAELGLNHLREVLWQKQYLPGPAGLDGSPQVRVQIGLNTEDIYDFVHDEQGTVIGIVRVEEPGEGAAPLLARYTYTPYGEARVEYGPELIELGFDPATTQTGDAVQGTAISGETAAGALVLETSLELDEATLEQGLVLKRKETEGPQQGQWTTLGPAEVDAERRAEETTKVVVMPLAPW